MRDRWSDARRRAALAIAAIAFSCPGTNYASDASDTRPLRLLQRFEELRRDAHIPGLSIAVVENRHIRLATGLGVADLHTGAPAGADTPYRIASVTKPLSATAIMSLVEAGTVDLDRPMHEYSHWVDFCHDFSETASIFARSLACEREDHTLRHLLSHTAANTPGDAYSYNPVLYSWASRPVMAAAGERFSALVANQVFAVAGMTRSARLNRDLPLPAGLARELAPPHRIGQDGRAEPSPPLSPQGDGAAGGIVSTVLDLARFDIAFDRGDLVTAETRDQMLTPTRANDGSELPYGLGWYRQTLGTESIAWHSGWWPEAYSALYLKVLSRDLTLVLLANSEGIWWGNPLDQARLQDSDFARAFLDIWLPAATVTR